MGAQVLGPHRGPQTVNTVSLALVEPMSFPQPLCVQVTLCRGSPLQKVALSTREHRWVSPGLGWVLRRPGWKAQPSI